MATDKVLIINFFVYVDHKLLSSKGAESFFLEMDYNLFHIECGKEFIETRYKVLENRKDSELGYVRNMNYDTAICIIQGDLEQAARRITELTRSEIYDDHVHTICNQGLLMIRRESDPETALDLAQKAIALLVKDKSRIISKIDYAYWIAEAERSEDARNTSCGIFEACLLESLNCLELDELRALCAYFYVKILIRMIRDDKDRNCHKSWYEQMIFTVVHLFLILANADQKLYLGDLWLWIAELQCHFVRNNAAYQLNLGLARLQQNEPQLFVNLEPENCLQQAIALRANYDYDIKFLMRIAKNCTEVAFHSKDRKQRRFWYWKAYKLSEECEGHNDNTFLMCLTTSIKARIAVWVMDYYARSKNKVLSCYRFRTGESLRKH